MARYGHPSKDKARERLLAAFSAESVESGSTAGSSQSAFPHGNGR